MSVFGKIAEMMLSGSKDGVPRGTPLPEINSPNDQSPEEQKLAAYVREKIDQVRQTNSRIVLEGIYLTNVAYLLGFDGVYYDTTYKQFKSVDPKKRVGRNRYRVNKILPTIQNRLSRLTKSPPRYDVKPNSNSTEDKDAARLSLEVLEDIFERERLEEKRQEAFMMAMQGGHAYIQATWDPTKGKPMVDPITGELQGYEGDVRIEALNCLEVFPDPLAKSIEDAQYIIKAKVRKLDYFRERYPERGHAVKEESAWLMSSIYDMKANALTTVGISGASVVDQMKNSAIELVYYERPSKKHPRGRMVVTANGILLEDKELPIGKFDIVKFDDIMIGGRYNPEAVITHLRPIQDQYNVTRHKCAEWIRLTLAGKYLSPRGANLIQEAVDDESGEVIEYDVVPNAPNGVTALNVPQIPAYVYKDLEALDEEFDFVSGINEVSRGQLPSASIPAAGMQFLEEQDQTRIGVQAKRNEISLAKLGQIVLEYVGAYYKMPRLLKKAGDGLEYAVKSFVGEDLKGNYDCIVIPGSTVPTSKVLKRHDILNAFNMGLLGDPMDPKVRQKVNKMLEYGDIAEAWKKQSLTEARAKQVIDAIESGTREEVEALLSEFDNHSMHLDIMDDYRLSDKYQALPPDRKDLFDFVMDWRLQALVNITNPELQQQQVLAQTMINQSQENVAQGFGPGGPMGVVEQAVMGPEPQGPIPLQETA